MPGPGSFEDAKTMPTPGHSHGVISGWLALSLVLVWPYWLLWVGNGRTVHRGGVSFFTMCFQDAENRGKGWLMGGMH